MRTPRGTLLILANWQIEFLSKGPDLPNEMSQIASALLTLAFAGAMLFAGQTFMRYRSAQTFGGPAYQVLAVKGIRLSPSVTPSRPQYPLP